MNSTGEYQNDGFYNTLSVKDKNLIVNHDFAIGNIYTLTLPEIIEEEKQYIWKGKVGLINGSDYLKSIINNNTFLNIYGWYWSMNPASNTRAQQISIHSAKLVETGYVYYGTGSAVALIPVVFLDSNIKLSGEGTKDNPYTIK